MSLFGTRPEIIRLSRIFSLLDTHFEHIMVNTNQNFTKELSTVFFKELQIRKPDYNLNVKTGVFGDEVSDIIRKSDKILLKEQPDILLILGDTNSGLSAIPAAHHNIPIAHLESGMRAYDYRMPEEKNRVLIDHLSTVLLPYTQYSRENLIRENIHPSKIHVVGNPIIEVINHYLPKIERSKILQQMKLKSDDFFLVTAHRSENVDNPKQLEIIFSSLEKIHKKFKKQIIFPMHPRTASKLKNKTLSKGIKIIKPLGFFDFTKLEKNSLCLITDSGTIPEETLYFKKPCVTIRDTTERPETIESGSNILSGMNIENIFESVKQISFMPNTWNWDSSLGNGKTASKVVNILRGKLERRKIKL